MKKKLYFLALLIGVSTNTIQANQQVKQFVIDGGIIPKFVEPLTTYNGERVDGIRKIKVTAKEFQQKILPNSFYQNLPRSVTYKSVETGMPLVTIDPREGTYMWGYEMSDGKKTYGPSYPAHTVEVERHKKSYVKGLNHLFPFKDKKGRILKGPLLQKFLTVDVSFQWANPLNWPQFGQGFDTYDPEVYPFGTGMPQGNPGIYEGPQPITIHLHGAENPSYADGDPNSWWTPGKKIKGASFVSNKLIYPNSQPATTLWFHDHVLGITRLSVLAGQAGFYFIRGEPESSVSPPLPKDDFEVEMIISDRQFDTHGQLFFPDGNPLTAGLNGPPGNPDINPYAIAEFFGDVMCVNGKSWPYLEVEPRRYRFRLLDSCNARFLALYLTSNDNTNTSVPQIWQIGTDGGLLDKPVNINSFIPFTYNTSDLCPPEDPDLGPVFDSPRLLFAPGERMDVIIDFTGYEGKNITVNNDAPGPFPGGGTLLDPDVEGLIMQFRVKNKRSSPDKSFNPAIPGATLRKGDKAIVRLANGKGKLAPGVVPNLTRSLVLIEQEDPYSTAPVVVLCNNTSYDGKNPYNKEILPDSVPYNNGSLYVTEIPQVGSTEIWELVNLTPDAHPIHIHLIQFQLINRQAFYVGNTVPPFVCLGSYRDLYETAWNKFLNRPKTVPPGTVYTYGSPFSYLSTPKLGGNPDVAPFLRGPVIAPDPNEYGWKDTIKIYPGTVTRLAIRWAPQDIPVGGVSAGENRFAFDPTSKLGDKKDKFGYPGGSGYVWHCNILDHEDNMMMRPFQVSNKAQKP
ncbi:MAG: multicopper oxidase domain-containing protein [Parachlamydiaceae bacterium]|nr:multicopper oxidase domain-containing protein [Parachlamydiaceae bacterium]